MDETPVSQLKQWYDQVKRDRRTWEPYWRDVKDFMCPQRGRFLGGEASATEVNDGARKDKLILDSTGVIALRVLASGMQSGLTSKARPWFALGHPDPALNRYRPVREWYDQVQEVLMGLFRRSNVYHGLLHSYYEMGGFGCGPLAILDHPTKTFYVRPFTCGTYYLSSNNRGEVDAFFYKEMKTVRQIAQDYPADRLPEAVKSALNAKKYEERFEVVTAVLREPERVGVKLRPLDQAASVHFMPFAREDTGFLRVSGYRSFPIMAPRWDVIDLDTYGWAPARDVIGTVMGAQNMEEDVQMLIAKAANPPMRIPPELERRGLDMSPGGLNPVANSDPSALTPLVQVTQNVQTLQYKIDRAGQDIREGMYNSLFLALLTGDNPQMTAREVAERHEEKLLMLGPVLERIHYELLDPLIERSYLLAAASNLIPPIPKELEEEPVQIEYISILSQAQKAVNVGRIEQYAQFVGSLVSVYPEMRHALRTFEAAEEYGTLIGVPARLMPSKDEYNKAVNKDQQAAESERAAAIGKDLAQGASLLSESDPANLSAALAGTIPGGVL